MKYAYLIFITLLLACQSGKNPSDLEAERQAILTIHANQQKAHLNKDVSLLLGDIANDYIEVNRGLIKRPTYDESYKKFKSYFDSVNFVKWEDVFPPLISFSDDGTMATVVVDKIAITKSTADNSQSDTTHFAWLAVYKKTDNKWKLHRMGSTNR